MPTIDNSLKLYKLMKNMSMMHSWPKSRGRRTLVIFFFLRAKYLHKMQLLSLNNNYLYFMYFWHFWHFWKGTMQLCRYVASWIVVKKSKIQRLINFTFLKLQRRLTTRWKDNEIYSLKTKYFFKIHHFFFSRDTLLFICYSLFTTIGT